MFRLYIVLLVAFSGFCSTQISEGFSYRKAIFPIGCTAKDRQLIEGITYLNGEKQDLNGKKIGDFLIADIFEAYSEGKRNRLNLVPIKTTIIGKNFFDLVFSRDSDGNIVGLNVVKKNKVYSMLEKINEWRSESERYKDGDSDTDEEYLDNRENLIDELGKEVGYYPDEDRNLQKLIENLDNDSYDYHDSDYDITFAHKLVALIETVLKPYVNFKNGMPYRSYLSREMSELIIELMEDYTSFNDTRADDDYGVSDCYDLDNRSLYIATFSPWFQKLLQTTLAKGPCSNYYYENLDDFHNYLSYALCTFYSFECLKDNVETMDNQNEFQLIMKKVREMKVCIPDVQDRCCLWQSWFFGLSLQAVRLVKIIKELDKVSSHFEKEDSEYEFLQGVKEANINRFRRDLHPGVLIKACNEIFFEEYKYSNKDISSLAADYTLDKILSRLHFFKNNLVDSFPELREIIG